MIWLTKWRGRTWSTWLEAHESRWRRSRQPAWTRCAATRNAPENSNRLIFWIPGCRDECLGLKYFKTYHKFDTNIMFYYWDDFNLKKKKKKLTSNSNPIQCTPISIPFVTGSTFPTLKVIFLKKKRINFTDQKRCWRCKWKSSIYSRPRRNGPARWNTGPSRFG